MVYHQSFEAESEIQAFIQTCQHLYRKKWLAIASVGRASNHQILFKFMILKDAQLSWICDLIHMDASREACLNCFGISSG